MKEAQIPNTSHRKLPARKPALTAPLQPNSTSRAAATCLEDAGTFHERRSGAFVQRWRQQQDLRRPSRCRSHSGPRHDGPRRPSASRLRSATSSRPATRPSWPQRSSPTPSTRGSAKATCPTASPRPRTISNVCWSWRPPTTGSPAASTTLTTSHRSIVSWRPSRPYA